ncbi:unnamed protein product [Spirodela intermedia]|uniref:PWWP domain-containing protein n=1 Tax=Spirodela intermedia TaxID=51605 RepID=A0A7I8KYW6_SPIIN|nr:unnamed protein product [Spirodela intermedia]
MGSHRESDKGQTKKIDETAGGLVWVRRRNGSWWPGRILGLDELPKSCSVSPRPGTPVKLLGREDGSMDWYNLEKSKRIKAFRCGEHDECIEKARAYAVQSIRVGPKERKYARREDAILHALEIEKATCMREKREPGSVFNKGKGIVSYVGLGEEQSHLAKTKVSKVRGGSNTKVSQAIAPLKQMEDLNTVEVPVLQKERWKAPTDSEDDGTGGSKRMRHLQELGLGAVSKRKLNTIFSNGQCQPLPDSSLTVPHVHYGFFNLSKPSSKITCSPLKEATQLPQIHETLKRKSRRRRLSKVLKSSATVEVPSVFCEDGNSSLSSLRGVASNQVRVSESAESKTKEHPQAANSFLGGSSETFCAEVSLDTCEDDCEPVFDGNDFNSLELLDDGFLDIPVVWKEIQTGDFSCGRVPSGPGKLQSGAVERQNGRRCKVMNEWNDALDVNDSSSFLEKETSKEYADVERKYKCGCRSADYRGNLVRVDQSESCLLDAPDLDVGTISKVSFDESPISDNGCVQEQARCELDSNDDAQGWFITGALEVNFLGDISHVEKVSTSRRAEVGQSDHRGGTFNRPISYKRPGKSSFLRDQSRSQLPPHGSLPCHQVHPGVGSSLYDVKLDVQASYQGPRVPLISLMSRFNGKAIVGHPITVEVVEDAYLDTSLGNRYSESCSIDMFHSHKENRSKRKRYMIDDTSLLTGGGITWKSERMASDQSKVSPTFSGRVPCENKRSGFLIRKTRRLSSIAVDHRHKKEDRKAAVEKARRPIACVPLKLVFSRINEALTCPSRPGNLR